jgi:hypothetical protein
MVLSPSTRDSMRRRCPALCAALIASALALVAEPNQAQTPPEVQRYFGVVRPLFSGDNARETVAFMDQYFRLPGNTGFDASIHRVAAILDQAGFVPQDRATPGARLTYRIEKRPLARPAWDPEDASLTIVGQSTPLLKYATNRNMLAINSYSTPPGGVEAELAYVNRGTSAEFDSAKVAGKIVMGDVAVGRLFTEAMRRGALGVLGYSLPAYTQPAVHQNSIQFTSVTLDTVRRGWAIPLSYAAHEELLAAVKKGPTRVRVMTRTRIFPSEELTLVADVRGAQAPDERFVFSAHVQEPGANDNASGVGTQAEMARVLADLVKRGAVSPARTITFIWGNEISAPRTYLREDSVRARGVRWGVSLDMVGEDTKLTGGTFLIEKMPDPSAIWTRGEDHHTEWGGGSPMKVSDMRPHYFNDFILQRCLDQAAVTGWVVKTNPFEGGSDHQSFLDAHKPGLLFWHFTDVYYHTDGDRLSMVSAQTMTNVGNAALVSALTLTSANAATAIAIIGEVERAALARLNAEATLSLQALEKGGDRAKETLILQTWTDWYRDALRSATDIEVGGPSAAVSTRINDAVSKVSAAGAVHVARLAGGRGRQGRRVR